MASATLPISAVLVKGTSTLERRSGRSRGSGDSTTCITGARSAGLRRVRNDRFALKSSFHTGGQAIAVPDAGVATGGNGGRIHMRVASKGAYICKDCGYIYSDRKPFDKLPADYSCPVCAAPKRRFKPYEVPVAKNANEQSVRKARKAELQGSSDGLGALPIAIAIGAAALVGVYLYTNSAF